MSSLAGQIRNLTSVLSAPSLVSLISNVNNSLTTEVKLAGVQISALHSDLQALFSTLPAAAIQHYQPDLADVPEAVSDLSGVPAAVSECIFHTSQTRREIFNLTTEVRRCLERCPPCLENSDSPQALSRESDPGSSTFPDPSSPDGAANTTRLCYNSNLSRINLTVCVDQEELPSDFNMFLYYAELIFHYNYHFLPSGRKKFDLSVPNVDQTMNVSLQAAWRRTGGWWSLLPL